MADQDGAVYIKDLAGCQPAECAVRQRRKRGAWHVQPYETAEFSGNLVECR